MAASGVTDTYEDRVAMEWDEVLAHEAEVFTRHRNRAWVHVERRSRTDPKPLAGLEMRFAASKPEPVPNPTMAWEHPAFVQWLACRQREAQIADGERRHEAWEHGRWGRAWQRLVEDEERDAACRERVGLPARPGFRERFSEWWDRL